MVPGRTEGLSSILGEQEWASACLGDYTAHASTPTPPLPFVPKELQGTSETASSVFLWFRRTPKGGGCLLSRTAFRRQNWEFGEEVKALPAQKEKAEKSPAHLPHPHLHNYNLESDSQETSTKQEVWSK